MNAQKKPKTKKQIATILLLIIIICLCVAGIVLTITAQRSAVPTVREALVYIGYLLALFYTLVNYRVPHGNLLKYTMLFFAVLLVVTLVINPAFYGGFETQVNPESTEVSEEYPLPPGGMLDVPENPNPLSPGQQKRINILEISFLGIAIILISFMAGRLRRIKENRIIIALVLALLLARAFLVNPRPQGIPIGLNEFIMWLVMSVSYLLRYRAHREAGTFGQETGDGSI